MFLIDMRLRNEVKQLRQEKASYLQASQQSLDLSANRRPEPLETARADLKKKILPPTIRPTTATLVLTASLTRGNGKETTLSLAPTVSLVRITLNVGNSQYSAYDIVLKPADASPIWENKNLHSRLDSQGIQMIHFQVPAKVLQNGDYVVKLAGAGSSENPDELGAYAFRIKRP
jgi:hypothetical protein